jgi:hypothetical protein
MSCVLVGIELKKSLGIAMKARVTPVDKVTVPAMSRGRPQVVAVGEDRLDGVIVRRCMGEGPRTSDLEALSAVGLGEIQDILRSEQALEDPVAEQFFDESHAVRSHIGCVFEAPVPVVSEDQRVDRVGLTCHSTKPGG